MTLYEPGDVVLVRFPFTDLTTIAPSLVERRLGKLSPADLPRVSLILRRLIAPIFA